MTTDPTAASDQPRPGGNDPGRADSAAKGMPAPAGGAASTLGVLFSRLSDQISKLFETEIALLKAKAIEVGTRAGAAVAVLAVAGVLALFALGTLIWAAVAALTLVLPEWAAALIVAGILLVIVAICAFLGLGLLKRAQAKMPDPKGELNADIAAIKKGLASE